MTYMDKKSEDNFNAWLDSIDIVDEEGVVISDKLTEDESDDPEGDRA